MAINPVDPAQRQFAFYTGKYSDGTSPAMTQGGKKQAPPPPDYQGAQSADLQANRPNQTNAFGSTLTYGKDANGNVTQTQGFGGPFGDLSKSLMGQAAGTMGQPMDWSQFGQIGNGDDARNQAINAAYGQATSRLNPQWAARDEALQAQLANQGLDPQTSQAGRMAQFQQNQARNDAYGSAMNSAIMQGQAAGDSVFRNNMMSRQQAIAEALKARGMPMAELGQLGGFLGQEGITGQSNQMGAAQALSNYYLGEMDRQDSQAADIAGGLFGGLGALGSLFGRKGK